MAKTHWHSLDRMALKALMRQFKRDDWLVLEDKALLAALDGSQPLSRTEWASLLESPLTLRRMAALEVARNQKRSADLAPSRVTAANDDHYVAELVAQAADSGTAEICLYSKDGWWELTCPPTHGGWKMRLELREGAPFVGLLEEDCGQGVAQRAVAVLDARGRTLLLGTLNDDRVLWGDWPLAEPPREALATSGTGIQVCLV